MDLLFYPTAPWQAYFSKSTQYQIAKLKHLKMDSECYETRKASEYCAVQYEAHTPATQLPHGWNFLQTSQFGK